MRRNAKFMQGLCDLRFVLRVLRRSWLRVLLHHDRPHARRLVDRAHTQSALQRAGREIIEARCRLGKNFETLTRLQEYWPSLELCVAVVGIPQHV